MIYVVLPRDRIGEVMRGELVHLPVCERAPVDAIVAVKVAYWRRPTCLLRVTACEPDEEGFTLTVRPTAREHEPRLLAADSSRGYTHDTRLALFDEPEAVDSETQDRITMGAIGRDTKRRREQSTAAQRDRALLGTLERIRAARDAARTNHVLDLVRDELRAVERRLRQGRPEETVRRSLTEIEPRCYREAA